MADQKQPVDPEVAEAKSKGVSVEELRKIKAIQEDAAKSKEDDSKGGSSLLEAVTGRPRITYTYPRGPKDQ